jgi:transcription factor 4/12
MHGMGSGAIHDPSGMGGYNVALSPAQDHNGPNNLMSSGLPPMSTFRNSATGPMGGPVSQSGVVQAGSGATVQSPSMYSHSPNLGPPPGPGGQTGDALGKALASVSCGFFLSFFFPCFSHVGRAWILNVMPIKFK